MSAVHTQSVEEVLASQRTTSAGLTPAEAAERLSIHGPNELRETISRPAWHMLLAQFREPLILILVAAAVLSLFLGDFVESIAILAIVFLFGVLGFIQEKCLVLNGLVRTVYWENLPSRQVVNFAQFCRLLIPMTQISPV